jgi:hypothetical protein
MMPMAGIKNKKLMPIDADLKIIGNSQEPPILLN